VVGTLADYKALTGQDLTTEGVGSATVTAADQDGTRGGPAVPAAVPSQDPMSDTMRADHEPVRSVPPAPPCP